MEILDGHCIPNSFLLVFVDGQRVGPSNYREKIEESVEITLLIAAAGG